MRKTIIMLPALAVLYSASAFAQSLPAAQADQKNQADTASQAAAGVGTHSTPGTLSPTDAKFLQDTAQGAAYELALAQMALQKASKPDVKQFAQTIVNDHEQLNTGLQHLAQVKGVQLPTGMSKDDQSRLDRMKSRSGSAFDHAFTTEMARINSHDKHDLDHEIGETHDNDVKAFAQQMQVADANHQKLSQHL